MLKSKISVIIPTYNRAQLLKETLKSLEAQNFAGWECIIVDDGSNPEEIAEISNFIRGSRKINFFKRPAYKIKGPSACRNYGLEKASGEFIQFFDDDDVMYPDMLFRKLAAILKNNADVVVSPLDHYYIDKAEVLNQNKIYSEDLVTDYVTGKITWYSSGPLWRKVFLTDAFDETIQTLDDYDFNLRQIYKNPKIEYLPEPLQRYNKYKIGETLSSKSRTGDEKQITSGFIAYRKQYLILKEKKMLNPELKEWLRNIFIYKLRASLVHKYPISNDIFLFLLTNRSLLTLEKLIKVITGYFSYKLFNKGYKLLSV